MAASFPEVFNRFEWRPVAVGPEWIEDALGGRCRRHYFAGLPWFTGDGVARPFRPNIGEDLFEWQPMLEAIERARGSFTMIELGCGFARWLVFAAGALRQAHPGMPAKLVGLELDPTHFQWAQQHVADNGIEAQLLHAAIGGFDGEIDVFVGGDPEGW